MNLATNPLHFESYLEDSKADPGVFMREILGIGKIWSGQEEIIKAVSLFDKVSVSSGHSLGKDYIAARLILWFLYTFYPSIVIATAPTSRQVEKVIWGELGEAFYRSKHKLGGRLLTKELIVDEKMKWYATGFTTKDVRKTQGKFQGFHGKNVFLLFSEAQAIEDSIWGQAESLMIGEFVRWIAIGNPFINYGYFHGTFKRDSGWKNITLDCEKSPNVIEDRQVIPGLCTRQWVDMMARKYGINSPTYRSKVKGVFPDKTVGAFINSNWLQKANTGNMLGSVSTQGIKALGADIAGADLDQPDNIQSGRAKTILTIRHGMKVTKVIKEQNQNTMITADIIAGLFRSGEIDIAYIDVTGVGTGIYHRLVQLGFKRKVVAINFGGRPQDDPNDMSALKNTDKYSNMATQMYDHVATLLEDSKIAFEFDDALNAQLSNRQMKKLKSGKKEIESKKQFKERGFDSPDEADSLVLCFCDAQPPDYEPPPYTSVDEEDPNISEIFR